MTSITAAAEISNRIAELEHELRVREAAIAHRLVSRSNAGYNANRIAWLYDELVALNIERLEPEGR